MEDRKMMILKNAVDMMSDKDKASWSREIAIKWVANNSRRAIKRGDKPLDWDVEEVYKTIQDIIDHRDA